MREADDELRISRERKKALKTYAVAGEDSSSGCVYTPAEAAVIFICKVLKFDEEIVSFRDGEPEPNVNTN